MKVSCDHCGRQYQVKPELAGRSVKCKACDQSFVIPQVESSPLDDPLGDLPSDPLPPARALNTLPTGGSTTAAATVEGPSDNKMRLASVGMTLAGVVLLGVNHAKAVMNDEIYLIALILGPFALLLGIAGMVNPNVVRAAGKYGKHLPVHYKLIAGAVGAVALVICLLLVFVVYKIG